MHHLSLPALSLSLALPPSLSLVCYLSLLYLFSMYLFLVRSQPLDVGCFR
jgi:hypothetical protein